MANSKISTLTSATTPLAGTEVLPVVQSSTTKQVSIANVTYGRDVSTRSLLVRSDSGPTTYYGTISHDAATTGANIYDLTSASGGGHVFRRGGSTLVSIDAGGNIIPATAAKGINFTANTPAAGMTSQLLNWYEEGTWTPVVTGFSADPAGMAGRYTRIGRAVTVQIYMPNAGTSNAIGFTVSLPFASGFTFQGMLGQATNNSAATTCVGYLTATSTTLTLYEGIGNNWAATNGKAANIFFTYFV